MLSGTQILGNFNQPLLKNSLKKERPYNPILWSFLTFQLSKICYTNFLIGKRNPLSNYQFRRERMGNRTYLVLTTTFLMLAISEVSLAAHPDNGPGCGLGKIAWGDHPAQQSILPQVFMASTNVTGLQPLAISSGTSGCTNDGTIFASEKVNVFAAINFDKISQEMAQGEGEHLSAFAILMDIPIDQHPLFFTKAQENYTRLLQSGGPSPNALIQIFHEIITNNPPMMLAAQTP
jgi:hypothetical protein